MQIRRTPQGPIFSQNEEDAHSNGQQWSVLGPQTISSRALWVRKKGCHELNLRNKNIGTQSESNWFPLFFKSIFRLNERAFEFFWLDIRVQSRRTHPSLHMIIYMVWTYQQGLRACWLVWPALVPSLLRVRTKRQLSANWESTECQRGIHGVSTECQSSTNWVPIEHMRSAAMEFQQSVNGAPT